MGTERGIDSASRGVHMQFVWKEQEEGRLLCYQIFENAYERENYRFFFYFLPAVNHWFCSQKGIISG